MVSGFTMLTTSFISERPMASAALLKQRRSSSVKRSRPGTSDLSVRFSSSRYSFCSVTSRHSNRATVAITGRWTQSTPRSPSLSILASLPQ